MKRLSNIYLASIFLFSCLIFFSCAQEEALLSDANGGRDDVEMAVDIPSAFGDDDQDDDQDGRDTDPVYIIPALVNPQFNENSILYLSQIGTTIKPEIPTGYNAATAAKQDVYTRNLYAYTWDKDATATWDEGYNFYPYEISEPLEWSHIRKRGPVGNSYNFIGLYYPYDNTTRFSVEEDQSTLENLLKSDVLGAFHSTSTLFSRLRFRLFHLMTYIRVTLYVPVYSTADNSGFQSDAFQGAWVLNVLENFEIEYSAGITSDSRGPVINAKGDGDSKEGIDIPMYAPLSATPEKKYIKVSDYYNDGTNDTDRTDEVYAYSFHALIPFPDTRYNSTETNKVDFLKFSFKTPGGSTKSYYFNDTQRHISDDHAGSILSLKAGAIQDLYLYLPRGGNGTIYVKATVTDWNNSSSDIPMYDGTGPSN